MPTTAPALSEPPVLRESKAKGRDHLEALLRHRKLDHTLAVRQAQGYPEQSRGVADRGLPPAERGLDPMALRWLVPTGMAALDARLEGGLPRGHLSEVVGPRSSGRFAVAVSALAGATSRGEAVALIDPLDMFDPVSAAAHHIDFQRMLWVRGEASSSSRVSLSLEYGTLQKSLDRGVKALNIVLQAGGFGLVVLDLGEMTTQAIKRLPYTTWLRLQRVIEGSDTACVLIGSEPIARSSGGVTVVMASGSRRLASGQVGPEAGSPTPEALYIDARVVRSRAINTDDHVRVPLSAAAC